MRKYNEITTLYVSPDGTGNGYSPYKTEVESGPLPGLQAAFNVVEQMRGGGLLQPLTIRMLGGTYFMSSPLIISNPVYSVSIEPYNDTPVVISGSRKITGFTPSIFNGVLCYAVYIEDVKNDKWSFTDLYVNNLRASITRYPDKGYLHKLDEEVHSSELFAGSKWFTAKKEDIPDFKNLNDCIVSFCHYWIDEHSPIESYDRDTGRLTMKYRSRFQIHSDIEYYIENVAEQFKNPGQWYLDRPSGMLYYIPRNEEEKPENIDVYAPSASYLVDVKGHPENERKVKNIHFRGLTFAYTKGDYKSISGVQSEKEREIFASDAQGVSNADGVINSNTAKADGGRENV